MAYGKAPEEVPHVRLETRMEENRHFEGRLQRREGTGRQRPGRHSRPRGGRGRPEAGVLGMPGMRLRAHVPHVGGDTAPVGRRAPAGDVTCGGSGGHVRARAMVSGDPLTQAALLAS